MIVTESASRSTAVLHQRSPPGQSATGATIAQLQLQKLPPQGQMKASIDFCSATDQTLIPNSVFRRGFHKKLSYAVRPPTSRLKLQARCARGVGRAERVLRARGTL